MDMAAMSTGLSQWQTQVDHSVRVNQVVKEQMEAVGEQVLQLIDSAAPVAAADPSSPLGQTIDIRV